MHQYTKTRSYNSPNRMCASKHIGWDTVKRTVKQVDLIIEQLDHKKYTIENLSTSL